MVVKDAFVMRFFSQYFSDECGATAIEYGLIGASIAVAIVLILFAIGADIEGTFNEILAALTG